MKENLIVVAHPNFKNSIVNKHWVNALNQYPEDMTIHNLYENYPTGKINVLKEQSLVENHKNLILQFPFYWFSYTPLLKQWLDEVLTFGWAYGSDNNKLKNKKIGLAISAGSNEIDYSKNGKYQKTLCEVLSPFELIIQYIQADYQGIFAFYGANNALDAECGTTQEKFSQSGNDYINWIRSFK